MKPKLLTLLAFASWCLGGLALLAGCNGRGGGTGVEGVIVDTGGGRVPPSAPVELLRFRAPPAEEGLTSLSADEARVLFKLIRMDALKKLSGQLNRENLREFADLKIPPRLLAQSSDYLLVTLYVPGTPRPLFAAAAAGTLAFSAAGAAYAALGEADPALLQTARIKIDIASSLTPCGPDARLVPGVDGLASAEKGLAYLPPDFFLGDEPSMAAYLHRLVKAAGLPPGSEKKQLMLAKFTTSSVLELSAGAEPVFLYRGNALIEPPSAAACRAGARQGLEWLLGAELADGRFPAAYFPYDDRYSEEKCSATVQAVRALAVLGGWRPRGPAVQPGSNIVDSLVIVQDPRYKFAFVSDPDADGAVSLGASALTLLALCERERAGGGDSKRAQMRALAEFILQQQTPEGELLSHFDPDKGRPIKKFQERNFPGQAVLALVRLYELDGRKDARLLEAAGKVARRLAAAQDSAAAEKLKKGAKPAELYGADPWLMQALAALTAVTEDAELARSLLAMADAVAAGQLTPERVRVPDLVGGLDEADPPGVGATAARAEGLIAALGAARRLGREEAAARYERALDLAAVYVLQNQFRPQNAYQLLRPERARGGFRLNVLAGELRPETAAHAAAFLLEYAGLKVPGRK